MSGYICHECCKSCEVPMRIELVSQTLEEFNLVVCPHCRTITSSLDMCCEEPWCKNEASCGTPYTGGYKHHCHLHPPKLEVAE